MTCFSFFSISAKTMECNQFSTRNKLRELQSRSFTRRQSTPNMYWREAIIKTHSIEVKPGTHLYTGKTLKNLVFRWVPGLPQLTDFFYDGFPPVHTRRRLTPVITSTLQQFSTEANWKWTRCVSWRRTCQRSGRTCSSSTRTDISFTTDSGGTQMSFYRIDCLTLADTPMPSISTKRTCQNYANSSNSMTASWKPLKML